MYFITYVCFVFFTSHLSRVHFVYECDLQHNILAIVSYELLNDGQRQVSGVDLKSTRVISTLTNTIPLRRKSIDFESTKFIVIYFCFSQRLHEF